MSRMSIPVGGGPTSQEIRREALARRRFERECERAYMRIAHLRTADELIARLRKLRFGQHAQREAIEKRLAELPEQTLKVASACLGDAREDFAMSIGWVMIELAPASLPILLAVLQGDGVRARERACRALAFIKGPDSAAMLIDVLLRDESSSVRAAAADAFCHRDDDEPVPTVPLRKMLHGTIEEREAAVRALERRNVPAETVDEKVLRLIGEPEHKLECYAGHLPAAAQPVLERLARSGDRVARQRSVTVLGLRGDDNTVLMEALGDPDEQVRAAAVTAQARLNQTFQQRHESRAELTDERWENLFAIDENRQPSARLLRVEHLHPGDVVRLWDAARSQWKFYWAQVLVVGDEHAALRPLESDEIRSVRMTDLRSDGWLHPDPARLLTLDDEWRDRIAALRIHWR